MNNVRSITFGLFLLILAAVNGFAQVKKAPATSVYDSQLAQKLGADQYGMRQYVLVLLKTGPTEMKAGKERDQLFDGHLANIRRLADMGTLVMAGPFMAVKNDLRGLFIFNAATVEDAQKLTESDPAIKAGVLAAEYVPWYGSAALLTVNETHKKIAKENP